MTVPPRRSTPTRKSKAVADPTARRRGAAPAAAAFGLDGAVWLRQGGHPLGGADRVALLEAVRDTGSMTHAARAVGISYKTAWDRVQAMNDGAGRALVERSAGGAGGGGTALTPYGIELIAAFRELERTHAQMLARLSKSIAQPDAVLRSLATLGLRTSARNQLVGTVEAVRRGTVNAVVELALPGAGDRIHASLTLASLRELGLKKGVQAVALMKAPSVMVAAADAPAARLSIANALDAEVTRIVAGAVSSEVQARLAGGQAMVAVVDADSVARLGLRVGAAVRLLFQESSVIVGVV